MLIHNYPKFQYYIITIAISLAEVGEYSIGNTEYLIFPALSSNLYLHFLYRDQDILYIQQMSKKKINKIYYYLIFHNTFN
jgi:hypothetical protein